METLRKSLEAVGKKYHFPSGYRLIFWAWYTGRNGNRVSLKDHGKTSWPLLVRIGK